MIGEAAETSTQGGLGRRGSRKTGLLLADAEGPGMDVTFQRGRTENHYICKESTNLDLTKEQCSGSAGGSLAT